MASCQIDHFPDFKCTDVDYNLNFIGNYYDTFYVYPNKSSDFYNKCKELIPNGRDVSYSNVDTSRAWRVQS